ncbi:L-rhamnose mutarotase [Enterococcus sp. BWB1-3]|uniref:L-rhamnose mutarotase n=1 Tax=Enterococcus sp. BWB1-3 TaxID=2787713 RepID=UPI002ED1A443
MKKAFVMQVYPDKHQEYEQRHAQLWPEMRRMLNEHGATSYSIFLEKETSQLFAYLEIEDEQRWRETAAAEINQKWWEYMADIMETNEDHSPVAADLIKVFEL